MEFMFFTFVSNNVIIQVPFVFYSKYILTLRVMAADVLIVSVEKLQKGWYSM